MTVSLESIIRAEIEASGPMRFARFVDLALYTPELGFYAASGQAGTRRGDFVTSVETGPLFAAMVGEWLDRRWHEHGRPDPFVVAEAAAGVGTLWRGIRKAEPACFDALEWRFVERSERLLATHGELPPGRWSSHAELPTGPMHAVIANELLDNLAFDLAEMTPSGWQLLEVQLTADDNPSFALAPSGQPVSMQGLPVNAEAGLRLPIPTSAIEWLDAARAAATHVLVFDYAANNATLFDRGMDGWLRTYRGHERGSDPFADVGARDITHDVPIDLLPQRRHSALQADWLSEHGLQARVDRARKTWQERAQIGDLAAMFARSAIGEAEALTDPTGLGAFHVLEW